MRKLLRLLLPILTILTLTCAGALAEATDDTLLLLASPAEPLPADYVPGDLRQISPTQTGVHLVTSRSMLLREEALNALSVMMRAAERDGAVLYVRQAYRSYADEQRRYEQLTNLGAPAQKPGESSYQTGLSVTLVGGAWKTKELTEEFASSAEARWLSAHAAEYGFVLRYPAGKEDVTGWQYEPWHYRYVGVSVAAAMTDQGLCLEELAGEVDVSELPEAELPIVEEPVQEKPVPDGIPFDAEEDAPEQPAAKTKEHGVPPQIDWDAIDPDDIGPDGDYEISLFGD